MTNPIKLPIKHSCKGCGKCAIKKLLIRPPKESLPKSVKNELKPIIKKLIKPMVKSMVQSLTPIALRQDLTFRALLIWKPENPEYKEDIKWEELKRESFTPLQVEEYFAEVRFADHAMWYLIAWMFKRFFPGRIHRFIIGYKELETGELMVIKLFAEVEDKESGLRTIVSVPMWLALTGLLPKDLLPELLNLD